MKFAICNEMFEDWSLERIGTFVAEVGYTGLELAPFTLAALVTDLDAGRRATIRQAVESAGLEVVGLHWLLAKTKGLHLTSADVAVRQRTAVYMTELVRFCADVGGRVMVMGSPQQRNRDAATSMEEAMDRAAEVFRPALAEAAESDVTFCMEPLAPTETNFITTADDGLRLVELVDHPNFKLHLDVKAMSSEGEPVPDIIRRVGPTAGHFHANDTNLRGPGEGETDFVPIFRALLDVDYAGWVSVEPFVFPDGVEACARNSLATLRDALAAAGTGSDQ